MILVLCVAATFSNQDPPELDSTARARIEQARASIAIIEVVDQSNETISQALGFFIRKDLVATDNEVVDKNSRLHLTTATQKRMIKVLSSGNYVLPYLLVETQPDVSPLSLADSERVALNDSVYILSDSGEINAGKVTGTTTIKNTRAFLISLAVNSNNKGAPIFNRYGEVIGIAAKSPDGQSAGLAWPSQLLATLKQLGEPGVGIGRGEGPRFPVRPPTTNTDSPALPVVDSKPVRLSSPAPRYTEAARANGTQGSVVLRVLVTEDGNVNAIRVVRGLPDGLTDQAIAVARLTKFKPAMKDGKPVPYWVALEINFNIR
jgi:TonB family protein